ncbi:MAG: transposase [Holosporaceae bacterium]|jgi:hypothetical protein|nr:transposase [Holosporaceae bacterium]
MLQAKESNEDLTNTAVLGDKGYDSKKFVDFLKAKNCEVIRPAKIAKKNERLTNMFIRNSIR